MSGGHAHSTVGSRRRRRSPLGAALLQPLNPTFDLSIRRGYLAKCPWAILLGHQSVEAVENGLPDLAVSLGPSQADQVRNEPRLPGQTHFLHGVSPCIGIGMITQPHQLLSALGRSQAAETDRGGELHAGIGTARAAHADSQKRCGPCRASALARQPGFHSFPAPEWRPTSRYDRDRPTDRAARPRRPAARDGPGIRSPSPAPRPTDGAGRDWQSAHSRRSSRS